MLPNLDADTEKAMTAKARLCVSEVIRSWQQLPQSRFAIAAGSGQPTYSRLVTGDKLMGMDLFARICEEYHFSLDEAQLLVRTLVDLSKEDQASTPTSRLEYTMEVAREFARSGIEADPRPIYTFFDDCTKLQREIGSSRDL